MFADLVPGSGAVSVSVGPSTALDAAALLKALDRYPFGCSEQITSRALPLLYVNELANAAAAGARYRRSISASAMPSTGLLARQGSDGSFGLWSVGGEDTWLDAYVTDFLTRARERGFVVPDVAFRQAIDRSAQFRHRPRRSRPRTADAISPMRSMCSPAIRRAPVGDLRYHRRHQARTISQRRSRRRRSRRRSACSAIVRGLNVSMRRRSMRSRRSRARNRTRRLRLVAARRCSAGDARVRRQCAAPDRHRRGGADRNRARLVVLHVDAGECLAGACRARDREGLDRRFAQRQRRDEAGRALSKRQCRCDREDTAQDHQ